MSGLNGDKRESGASRNRAPYRLVLGFERIGLIALRTPIFSAMIAAALCVVAAFGVGKLKVDDSAEHAFPLE